MPEPAHQGVREGERLGLVPALGAVDDPDPGADGMRHALADLRGPGDGVADGTNAWRFDHPTIAARRDWISAMSCERTSSSSSLAGASGEPNSGWAA